MLKKIFDPILRFFTLLASALAGITACCTAVGFLAHRAHLNMLGVSNIPVDLNQYMYTGAQFLAYLPFKLMAIMVLNLLDFARTYFLFFIIALILMLLFYRLRNFKWVRKFIRPTGSRFKNFIKRHRMKAWAGVLVGQFVAVHFLLKSTRISSLLFGDSMPVQPSASGEFYLLADVNSIAFWISNNKIGELMQYLGWLSLIIISTALILWKMVGTYRKEELNAPTFWQTTLLGINFILFCTQIILFPINYGILLLSNEYPGVDVELNQEVNRSKLWPEDERLLLMDNQNGRFYFYSKEMKRLWYIKESDIHSISYFGMVNAFKTVPQGGAEKTEGGNSHD